VDLLEAVVLPGLRPSGSRRRGQSLRRRLRCRQRARPRHRSSVPQVVKAIRLQWKQGLGEARIRLEPEHLGEVRVSLRVQAGAVTAVVTAENPTVQA